MVFFFTKSPTTIFAFLTRISGSSARAPVQHLGASDRRACVAAGGAERAVAAGPQVADHLGRRLLPGRGARRPTATRRERSEHELDADQRARQLSDLEDALVEVRREEGSRPLPGD